MGPLDQDFSHIFFAGRRNKLRRKEEDECCCSLAIFAISLQDHKMTLKVRKWMTGSEGGEPSNYLICRDPGDLLVSISRSLVEEGETSSIAEGFNEIHHSPLHDACIERTLRMLIRNNASVNDNGRRLMEELSENSRISYLGDENDLSPLQQKTK